MMFNIEAKRHGRLSKLLVKIATMGQYGRSCTPRTFIMVGPTGSHESQTGYCEYYWSSAKWDTSFEDWLKVVKLSRRYRRFVEYVEEVKPRWRKIDSIHYADNSVDVIELADDGRTRRRMTVSPHGD